MGHGTTKQAPKSDELTAEEFAARFAKKKVDLEVDKYFRRW